MFGQIKEMKAMPEDTPGLTEQAELLGAQARLLAVAQQAARQADGLQAGCAGASYAPNFEPIAGVCLEQYAAIVKCAAAFGHDPSKLARVAAARGISSVAWQMAVAGWNARLRGDAAVARRFNLRYRES